MPDRERRETTRQILGRFRSDGDLNVSQSTGTFVQMLGCDSADVMQQEWRKYVHYDSADEIVRMQADILNRHAGTYAVCNVGKTGEKFYVAVQTIVGLCTSSGAITVAGVSVLEMFSSPRTYVFMARMLRLCLVSAAAWM